jgi:hypothetical protein
MDLVGWVPPTQGVRQVVDCCVALLPDLKLSGIGSYSACNRLKRSDVNAMSLNYKVGLIWEAGIHYGTDRTAMFRLRQARYWIVRYA